MSSSLARMESNETVYEDCQTSMNNNYNNFIAQCIKDDLNDLDLDEYFLAPDENEPLTATEEETSDTVKKDNLNRVSVKEMAMRFQKNKEPNNITVTPIKSSKTKLAAFCATNVEPTTTCSSTNDENAAAQSPSMLLLQEENNELLKSVETRDGKIKTLSATVAIQQSTISELQAELKQVQDELESAQEALLSATSSTSSCFFFRRHRK